MERVLWAEGPKIEEIWDFHLGLKFSIGNEVRVGQIMGTRMARIDRIAPNPEIPKIDFPNPILLFMGCVSVRLV